MTHLQEILLSIASDIDKLLKQNNIPYYLDGGSALGAVRHKGFIPWDDDFDIIILPEYYEKFVNVCREQLDKQKYTFIEAEKDWPMHISKIKLKGTSIEEVDEYPLKEKGIYIDIFCFDNASNFLIIRYFQWICTRIWTILMIASKPYTTSSTFKRLLIHFAKIINSPNLRRVFRYLGRSHNPTDYLSMAWCRTRSKWTRYFCRREIFSSSKVVEFENKEFPIAKDYDSYLKICFGDYMKLPPIEKRIGLHIKAVDFGKY